MSASMSPMGRVSFAHVFDPRKNDTLNTDGSPKTPKYELQLIFEDPSVLQGMKQEALAVAKAKWPKLPASAIAFPWKKCRSCIIKSGDCQGEIYDGYDNDGEFIAFRSESKPVVKSLKRGPNGKFLEIAKESGDFYGGCYAHVSYSCFATNKGGTNRVCFGLENVQKLKDGTPFGRVSSSADDDFADVDVAAYEEDLEVPEDADMFA